MDADGLPIVGTGIDFTKEVRVLPGVDAALYDPHKSWWFKANWSLELLGGEGTDQVQAPRFLKVLKLKLCGLNPPVKKVGAIHQKRTLAFLNHFISHTARFLNRFSCVCEEKLEALAIRLQRLETTMSLLEAKLASVPGLENVTAPSTTTTPSTPQSSNDSQTSTPAAPVEAAPVTEVTPEPAAPAPTSQEAVPTAAPEESSQMTVSQDPRYARFFKLVQVGVPIPAVKLRMTNDGLNPDLLDTPNAPAPSGDQAPKGEDGEAEFSSDEAGEASSSDDDSSGFSD